MDVLFLAYSVLQRLSRMKRELKCEEAIPFWRILCCETICFSARLSSVCYPGGSWRQSFLSRHMSSSIWVSLPQKQQGTGSGSRDLSCLYHFHMNYMRSWKVLAMTSSCCSLVSLIKFTAYPETRIVSCGYCSGCFCASKSVSRFNTLTFK